MKSELNGDFQVLAVMLTHDKSTFLSIELHETMAGAGTDEPALTEVLMSRTNQELADLRTTYGLCKRFIASYKLPNTTTV